MAKIATLSQNLLIWIPMETELKLALNDDGHNARRANKNLLENETHLDDKDYKNNNDFIINGYLKKIAFLFLILFKLKIKCLNLQLNKRKIMFDNLSDKLDKAHILKGHGKNGCKRS
jgi:hypothetical protein